MTTRQLEALREPPRREVAGTNGSQLALTHERVQHLEHVGERDVVRGRLVQLVEIDPVRPQPGQTLLALTSHMCGHVRGAELTQIELGGDHPAITATFQHLTQERFGLAVVVDVRGVDEVDTEVAGGVDDLSSLREVEPRSSEDVASEPEERDLDPARTQRSTRQHQHPSRWRCDGRPTARVGCSWPRRSWGWGRTPTRRRWCASR